MAEAKIKIGSILLEADKRFTRFVEVMHISHPRKNETSGHVETPVTIQTVERDGTGFKRKRGSRLSDTTLERLQKSFTLVHE